MARAHTTRGADCNSPTLRYSRALLLSAITGLLASCGGGGGGGGGERSAGGGCAVTGAASAVLTWDAVQDDPDLLGYKIHYGIAPGMYSQFDDVSDPNATTHSVMGLSSGTTYYFAATAYDAMNNESFFSNEVCKTIS